MEGTPFGKLAVHFGSIEDPRDDNLRHKLLDIIFIALCAIICGANSWVEVELYGRRKLNWLRQYLELPNGIPSHDTFGRLFARINPEAFQQSFVNWTKAIQELTQGEVIALDGKQLRGSHDQGREKSAIYMVSAWASTNRLVLGQRKVDEKSNEITAIPKLLELLELRGCIVTIDALGTQTKIAKQIVEQGGDYLLAVKENQGRLYQDLVGLFSYDQAHHFQGAPYQVAKTVNKNHGRIEIRQCWTTSDPEYLNTIRDRQKWKGLNSIVMIVAERISDQHTSTEIRYYISSLPANAEQHLQATRGHWGIENSLHWVLDLVFNEDHCRVRKDHAPANLSILRHMAVNLLQQEKTAKGGVKAKRFQAALDETYLLRILAA